MLTDPIGDLHAALRSRPALIVHFSGVPKGVGHSVQYPDDLQWALTNPHEILCCSTIEPGDFIAAPMRATGTVGVVVGPENEEGIVFVCQDDVGSPPNTVDRLAWNRPLSVGHCRRSFTRNGNTPYNEWLVGPYRIIGLFVASDAQVQVNGRLIEVDTEGVLANLGKRRVFSDVGGEFVELDVDGRWMALDMSSVYP